MRGEPRRGSLRHFNQEVSELFEVLKLPLSLPKSIFGKLSGPMPIMAWGRFSLAGRRLLRQNSRIKERRDLYYRVP